MACSTCGKQNRVNLSAGREFAVYLDGAQVGDNYTDSLAAAKAARKVGGMIKMVASPS